MGDKGIGAIPRIRRSGARRTRALDCRRQADQIPCGHAGPAVQPAAPLQRDSRRPVCGAEQSAGDGRDGVGVETGTHGRVEPSAQVRGPATAGRDDGRPRGLQCGDHPTVVGDLGGTERLGVIQASSPQGSTVGVEVAQSDPDVEFGGQYRVPDRAAPQHGGVTRVGVEMGELADGPRRGHHGVLVVEVGRRHRSGTHERAVTGGAAGALVVIRRRRAGRDRGDRCVPRRRRQHGPGLDADILGGQRPCVPARHDRVLGRLVLQIGAGRGDLGDGDGHRGVIGPLAGLPRPAAGHLHRQFGAARRLELVRRPQGVAGGGAQQHALGAIVA